jgi:hypothetical protein
MLMVQFMNLYKYEKGLKSEIYSSFKVPQFHSSIVPQFHSSIVP